MSVFCEYSFTFKLSLNLIASNGRKATGPGGCIMSDFVAVSRARFAFRLALTGVTAGAYQWRELPTFERSFVESFPEVGNGVRDAPASPAPLSPVQSRPLGAPIASASQQTRESPPPRRRQVRKVRGLVGARRNDDVVAQGENAQIVATVTACQSTRSFAQMGLHRRAGSAREPHRHSGL